MKAGVYLTDQARDSLRTAARGSVKLEHGGILVGYRSGRELHVYDALTVPDKTSDGCNYLRRSIPAEQVLQAYLEGANESLLGYVGEWHTHPQLVPPSGIDIRSMREISRGNAHTTALIVAALEPRANEVHFFGLMSRPSRRLYGGYRDVQVHHSCA